MSAVKRTNTGLPIQINTKFWLRITGTQDTQNEIQHDLPETEDVVGVSFAENDPNGFNRNNEQTSPNNSFTDKTPMINGDPNTKEDLASVNLDMNMNMNMSKIHDGPKVVPGSVDFDASIVPVEENTKEISTEVVPGSVALEASIVPVEKQEEPKEISTEEVPGSVALEASIVPVEEEPKEISTEEVPGSVDFDASIVPVEEEPKEISTEEVPGSVDFDASIVPVEEEPKEISTEEVPGSVDFDASIVPVEEESKEISTEEVPGSVALEASIVPEREGEDSNVEGEDSNVEEEKENATVEIRPTEQVDQNTATPTMPLTRSNAFRGLDPTGNSPTSNVGPGNNNQQPTTLSSPPAPGNIQPAITSIRDIGLQGTVYFYVNQDTDKPLLMSGDINHYFEIKDTEIRCETNLPIQITHNITQNLITPKAPFNANVTIKGDLCIGGNVYTITSGNTIDVSNIVQIPPLPDARLPISKPDFFQKYFEYSGKIYMDNWSSKIHWCTFYNPDNYMVPRELPTKNANNGITKEDLSSKVIGNWALYQRKINMYIGKITVMGNVLISPPPFSIDMQMTSESVTGGTLDTRTNGAMPSFANTKPQSPGKPSRPKSSVSSMPEPYITTEKVTDPVKSSEKPPLKKTLVDKKGSLNSSTQKPVGVSSISNPEKSNTLIHSSNLTKEPKEGILLFQELLQNASPELKKKLLQNIPNILKDSTNNNQILETITTEIIEPLVTEASERDPNITKSDPTKQLRTMTEKLLNSNPELLMDIFTQLNQSPKNQVVDSLRKPDNIIQVKISGELTTSSGRKYGIHHIIFLSYEPRVSNNSPIIYKVFQITKEDSHITHSSTNPETNKSTNKSKKTFYVQGNFGVDKPNDTKHPSPFAVLWGNQIPIELDILTGKQSKQTPSLDISYFHIYIGDKPIQNRNPLFIIHTKLFQLHKDSNTETNEKDVLCDFHSSIKVIQKTITNRTIQQTHKTFEYDVIIPDKVISSKKSNTKKHGGKRGGRRTRRFR